MSTEIERLEEEQYGCVEGVAAQASISMPLPGQACFQLEGMHMGLHAQEQPSLELELAAAAAVGIAGAPSVVVGQEVDHKDFVVDLMEAALHQVGHMDFALARRDRSNVLELVLV